MGWQRTAEGTGHVKQFWSGTTLDGEKVAVVLDITEAMIDRAAEAYEFGVMPGDESEATPEEIRQMAERVLRAALSPDNDHDEIVNLRTGERTRVRTASSSPDDASSS